MDTLEEQLGASEEKSSQLRHELTAKNELLHVYSRVYESQEDLSTASPVVLSPENGEAYWWILGGKLPNELMFWG